MAAAGRLSEEKRYDMLLRVHKRLLDEGLLQDLWIIGEGDQRGKLEEYITKNHLSDSVKLFGFQSNPYPYLNAADLLVCASRYEGLSTFVTEGLILGKPIVTTECSGMRELLGESKFGLIVENTEPALFIGLQRLLKDAELRNQYAGNALLRGTDFSSGKLAKETEQFFIDLLKDQNT